nr:hypothetical protein [Tanacetum cinerariifolium]
MYVHDSGQRYAQRVQVQDALAVRVVHRRLHHALGLAQHDALLTSGPQPLLGALGYEIALQLGQHGEDGEQDFVGHVAVVLRVQVQALLDQNQPAPLLVNQFLNQTQHLAQRATQSGELGDNDGIAGGYLGQQLGQAALPGGPSGGHLDLHPFVQGPAVLDQVAGDEALLALGRLGAGRDADVAKNHGQNGVVSDKVNAPRKGTGFRYLYSHVNAINRRWGKRSLSPSVFAPSMATHLRIHLGKERELYEQPPLVPAAEQARVFAVPAWADAHLARMLTPGNRVGFVLQLGYFQISQRFYVATRYHAADVAYMVRQLGLGPADFDPLRYADARYYAHQQLICEQLGITRFDAAATERLYQEAVRLSSQHLKPSTVFDYLVLFLHEHRLELPTYNTLADLITRALLAFEKRLLHRLQQHLQPGPAGRGNPRTGDPLRVPAAALRAAAAAMATAAPLGPSYHLLRRVRAADPGRAALPPRRAALPLPAQLRGASVLRAGRRPGRHAAANHDQRRESMPRAGEGNALSAARRHAAADQPGHGPGLPAPAGPDPNSRPRRCPRRTGRAEADPHRRAAAAPPGHGCPAERRPPATGAITLGHGAAGRRGAVSRGVGRGVVAPANQARALGQNLGSGRGHHPRRPLASRAVLPAARRAPGRAGAAGLSLAHATRLRRPECLARFYHGSDHAPGAAAGPVCRHERPPERGRQSARAPHPGRALPPDHAAPASRAAAPAGPPQTRPHAAALVASAGRPGRAGLQPGPAPPGPSRAAGGRGGPAAPGQHPFLARQPAPGQRTDSKLYPPAAPARGLSALAGRAAQQQRRAEVRPGRGLARRQRLVQVLRQPPRPDGLLLRGRNAARLRLDRLQRRRPRGHAPAGGPAAARRAAHRRAQHRHARLHGSHLRRDPDAGHRLRAAHPPAHQPAALQLGAGGHAPATGADAAAGRAPRPRAHRQALGRGAALGRHAQAAPQRGLPPVRPPEFLRPPASALPGPERTGPAGVPRGHPLRAAGGRNLQAPVDECHHLLELPAPLPAPGPAAPGTASYYAGHALALRRALLPPREPARRVRLL